MRKIAVFTGSRAEYSLLHPLLTGLRENPRITLQLIVAAMHLSPEFGMTARQIEADGFVADARVEMLLSSDSPVGVAKSMGLGLIGLADALDRLRPDVLILLGDRFETLAAAQVALVMRIPIAHIHGGEVTQGAYDDAIRHAITKMASLHFVAASDYRRRVIQLGERPETVFDVGALGVESIRRAERHPVELLSRTFGFDFGRPYLLVTYHPVTAGDEDPVSSTDALLSALDGVPGYRLIFTYPNADNGGRAILERIQEYASNQVGRVLAVPSLGREFYPSVLAGAAAVVGNSSSAIIEAPALGIPAVDVGIRQKGRMAAASVIHCPPDATAISAALRRALSDDFANGLKQLHNPYGDGQTSARIIDILEGAGLSCEKPFHDLETGA
ncbi:MAG TPA: UDP-N-acetylglucosamine 2-epimerase [Frateuria sp.]|uniref:UDP-N-acetylglucosamine 2-epimerase n=1 Tax=Frateuria sp. TaxID=2211372 RepID=UPI002D7EADFE|nr:UDP-N-acetylglucosamine 2-epimerase [Frateuria sp.]HET6804141.1 UDP-N-acetylglucosamine 2-epimerase [Frateuria sp.]